MKLSRTALVALVGHFVFALLLVSAVCPPSLAAPARAAPAATAEALTLERIHADPPLAGRLPRSAAISPGGRFVSYLQPSAADSQVLELWAQPLPSGAPRRLAATSDLIGSRTATLTEAEKMALERRRVSVRGITNYSWCGEQDQRLVVPLAGDLYLIELQGERSQVRRLTFDEAVPERDPQCDREGRQIAYVKNNDLWLQPLGDVGRGGAASTGAARSGASQSGAGPDGAPAKALSAGGSETRSTGLAEFIAAEEFGRFDGYWWSRDGRQLLALEVDESQVPLKTRMQIRAEGSDVTTQRYPAAGETNARVIPLVIDAATGASRRLAVPERTEYIVRAGWFADGTPWLQTMPRDQTALRLTSYAPGTFEPRQLVEDTDAAWVDVHSDLHEIAAPEAPPGLVAGTTAAVPSGAAPSSATGAPAGATPAPLLWSSERSGRRQLYRLDRASGTLTQLTDLPEPVVSVVCASSRRIVFTGERERGRARTLYEIDAFGQVREIAPGAAKRWRNASADTACTRLLVQEAAWGRPAKSSVVTLGSEATPIELQGAPPDPLLARIVPAVQTVELTAADGKTPLNAFYLPPLKKSSNPAGHAVIVETYGGPTGQMVAWSYARHTPLYAHWQRLGFGVLLVDNRGMGGRGRDFSRAHYRAFGQVEVDDLFAAVRQLSKKVKGIDAARIGVTGWSYGGYLTLRAMLDSRSPFAAGVAGAPVVDWTLYDTAYTERYLGLPDGGSHDGARTPAYRTSDLLPRAPQLGKPLLILHGTADDNVLFEHSLRMVQALETSGKLFETGIYPGQTHSISGRALQLHVDLAATDFFVRRLKP